MVNLFVNFIKLLILFLLTNSIDIMKGWNLLWFGQDLKEKKPILNHLKQTFSKIENIMNHSHKNTQITSVDL